MINGDVEKGINDDEEVSFLPMPKPVLGNNVSNERPLGALLTREDLLRLENEEPVWRRARLILLAAFWVLWAALLAAAIVVIVLAPKCPPNPTLRFWERKVGYWVDPFAFADSNGDGIGDLKGLVGKLDYVKNVVGAGFVILGSVVQGHYSNSFSSLGLVQNFTAVDNAVGTIDDFRSLVKTYHRNGLEVVVSLDFNSVSLDHSWTRNPGFLRAPFDDTVLRRDGSSATVDVNGRAFYSVGDKNSVDLDLSFEDVVTAVNKIVEYWLSENVDGILLTNAAFYVEDTEGRTVASQPLVSTNNSNNWFSKYPVKQIFGNGSIDFVTKLRSLVDAFSVSSGKERLLAVDTGDVGYGLEDSADRAIEFLGTDEHPAAHMVISRQFVKYRGWKAEPEVTAWQEISVQSYNVSSGDRKSSLGLSTATPSDQRHNSIAALSSIFLLPGTPLIYYGSELAIQLLPKLEPPTDVYTIGKIPFPTISERDSQLVCQLPMPWDLSGTGFSPSNSNVTFGAYLEKYGITETVDSALSVGRGDTPFKMVQELVKLREKPSIKWGDFSMVQFGGGVNFDGIEIFERKATGYPAFVVALINRVPNYGATFSFANVCESIIPRLTYPGRPAMKLGEAVDSNRIYLETENEPAVYVFECA